MNKNLLNKYCRRMGFEIHGTGYMQSIRKTSFKDDTFEIQKKLLKRCNVIFDVGANRGDIALKYLSLFPQAKIYAFEPFPGSFEILNSRLAGKENVYSMQVALGKNNGKTDMFVNKNVDTNSLLKPTKMGLSSDEQVDNISTISVSVLTIDEFCTKNLIEQIDILKLDIQGGELAALQGAKYMLEKQKIKLIYTETYFKNQYEEQPLFHDISKYLEDFGYEVQDFYNPIYGKGSIVWCDTIFLKKR